MLVPKIAVVAFCLSAAFVSALGAEDLTEALECLGVPGAVRWPREPKYCRVTDLQVYKDRVYVGFGEYNDNVGPCPVVGIDAYDGSFHTEYTAGIEQIDVYRVFSDGRLYLPSVDHMDKGDNPNGHWFRRETNDQ